MGNRLITRGVLIALILGAGFWLRTLQPLHLMAAWPWTGTTVVTLYFLDGGSDRTRPTDPPYLFPLSRHMPAGAELSRAAVEALLAGPPAGSRLRNALPPGITLRSIDVSNGIARVDLSGPPERLRDSPGSTTALVATLTGLPGVSSAALSIDGAPIDTPVRMALLYYPSADGLVATPTPASGPRATLEAFLAGPANPALTGMPPDARLVDYAFDADSGQASLAFAYTPSVRTLALERPDRMRFLLLGLIATLTGYPEVRSVRLDFGGQSRLGLGECSDLLRTPQPRPALLNDERLLR